MRREPEPRLREETADKIDLPDEAGACCSAVRLGQSASSMTSREEMARRIRATIRPHG